MDPGFDSFDDLDKPTINPCVLMQVGNRDSISTSMQPKSLELPQGNERYLALDYSSLSAPAPLSVTGFAPEERAAVCTDSSTVGHQYPGDDKIPQSVPMPSS